jgi:hypothetical protein
MDTMLLTKTAQTVPSGKQQYVQLGNSQQVQKPEWGNRQIHKQEYKQHYDVSLHCFLKAYATEWPRIN